MKSALPVIGAIALVATAHADVINVPADHATIQGAINAAFNGDEIIVQPGTYNEALNYFGKNLIVRSTDPTDPDVVAATIIDAAGTNLRAVTFGNNETNLAVFSGFYCIGGDTSEAGGACAVLANPTISYCVFDGNYASFRGGAIYNLISDCHVHDCIFINNSCDGAQGGGAVLHQGGNPIYENCVFYNNMGNGAGAIIIDGGSGQILNCEVRENIGLDGLTGGIWFDGGTPVMMDTYVCGNTPSNISGSYTDAGGNAIDDECAGDKCPADLSGDGTVSVDDLLIVLSNWSVGDGGDVNGDGMTTVDDLLIVLSSFGPC